MDKVFQPSPPVGRSGADTSIAATTMGGSKVDPYVILANNRAYNKLVAEAHAARANLALSVIDLEKSIAMIALRGGQLLKAARSLKRGDFAGAAGAFKGARSARGGRGRSRSRRRGDAAHGAADAWNELQFGWLPAIQDIHDAVKVLANTPPSLSISGHGSSKYEIGPFFHTDTYPAAKVAGVVGVRMQCRVRVTSPNLLLLNELGLINPAYVLWDAVPFSFVLDWFYPIGTFLRHFTDFVGLEITDSFTTTYKKATDSASDFYVPSYRSASTAITVNRVLGIPAMRFPTVLQYHHGLWKQVTETALIFQNLLPALSRLEGSRFFK